jgi:hypothetical protein
MKNNPGFCYDIFKNQAFCNNADGSVVFMPCCVYQGFVDKNVSPDQSWKGQNRKKLISIIEEGKILSGCKICYQTEAQGLRSRRQADKEHYEFFLKDSHIDIDAIGPTSLDYSVGNLCNLKCVICDPNNSTAWIPDYQKLYPGTDISNYLYRKNHIIEIEDPGFLQNIKNIHFHGGGEPLMGDAHINLLKQVKKVKGLQDVRIYYNTNGTQQVSQEVLDLWQECLLVELYFSIDDVRDRFEYQRKGASWQQLNHNLQWFKENMPHNHMFNVNCVWSYLNFYYLNELIDWHTETFNQNRYGDPCHLIFQKGLGIYSLKHIDMPIYQILERRFAEYPDLIEILKSLPIDDKGHDNFWQHIKKLDQIRGSSFSNLCPEWSRLLS